MPVFELAEPVSFRLDVPYVVCIGCPNAHPCYVALLDARSDDGQCPGRRFEYAADEEVRLDEVTNARLLVTDDLVPHVDWSPAHPLPPPPLSSPPSPHALGFFVPPSVGLTAVMSFLLLLATLFAGSWRHTNRSAKPPRRRWFRSPPRAKVPKGPKFTPPNLDKDRPTPVAPVLLPCAPRTLLSSTEYATEYGDGGWVPRKSRRGYSDC